MIKLIPIENVPIIKLGDDIASLIHDSTTLSDGDIVVIAHTIISRSEGATIDLDTITPSKFAVKLAAVTNKDPALVEVILRNSRRISRSKGHHIIAETQHGYICANAGIDQSNSPKGTVIALPLDPDASARKIRNKLIEKSKKRVAVIITDTWGRPFRKGAINFAIGCAGIHPMVDYRGKTDLFGKELKTTQICHIDELAASAGLIMGQSNEGMPVIIIRGYNYIHDDDSTAKVVIREEENDIFR